MKGYSSPLQAPPNTSQNTSKMAFKLVVLSCMLAFAQSSVVPAAYAAGPVAYAAAPVRVGAVAARLEDYDPLPQYRFGYDVADSLTGDYKSQNEQRDGDVVQGQYSLVEPDGTRRIVDYAADPINGFNAVVRKEPLVAPAPAVVAQPAVVEARYAVAPAPVPAPAYYSQTFPTARYAAAPVVARYAAAAPVAAAPAYAQYAAAAPSPVYDARYAAAPVVAARYAAPVGAAYRAPLAAYTSYPAPVAAYRDAPLTAYAPYAYSAPLTSYGAPAAFRAAPAKIVEPVAAAGYRYP